MISCQNTCYWKTILVIRKNFLSQKNIVLGRKETSLKRQTTLTGAIFLSHEKFLCCVVVVVIVVVIVVTGENKSTPSLLAKDLAGV